MPKLEEKTREEWSKIWRNRIEVDSIKHKKRILDWADKVIQEYTGDFKSDKDTGEHFKQVCQVIVSVEETIQPHLYFQNPKMTASAKIKHPEWERRTEDVEEMVNHKYREIWAGGSGIEMENELALLDARILGYGVTESRRDVEGDYLEEPEEESLMDKAKNFMTGQEAPVERVPVITKDNGIVTEHISALDIILDSTAKHITKQKRTIKKVDLSLDDLKNSRYDQDAVEKLKPVNIYNDKISGMSDEEKRKYCEENPDYKGFRAYECHDLENRVIHTLVQGYNDFIEFGTPYPIKEGSQFNFLYFIDSPNDVYPLPPLKFYRKRALEFSYIYSQISEQIDKFLPRVGVDTTKLDRPNQIKFENGTLGTMFGTNGSPEGAIKVFTAPVQADLFKYLAAIKELLNMESASNDYELASPEERKATEAKIIQGGTSARRFKPKKRVAGFIKAQAHTIWQFIRDTGTIEEFTNVLGEETAFEWWNDPVTGKAAWESDESTGDFWFDFDMESMAPMDQREKMLENEKKMETVLNPALRDGLAIEGKTLLISPIFETYAKQNLGIHDLTKVVQDQNIPTADEEHSLWMQGQYPPISQEELKNPHKLMEHFQKHDAYVKSPGFQMLPPDMKEAGYQHRDSYLPHVQKLMAKNQTPQAVPA